MRDRTYRSRLDQPPAPKRSAAFTGWIESRTLATPVPEDVRLPAPYDDRDIAAVKACRMGTASPEQQQRAMEWIIQFGCATYNSAVYLDPEAAMVMQGRRFAGAQIVKLINSKTRAQSDSEQG